ncbi:MAG: macro domain-containing protein [Polyangiales bacterium]|nr:macro domain-containing protein [Myxococcales bacterium]MCB9659243.1 macro domain-containing protein [Sandaracinaceae bacterium]
MDCRVFVGSLVDASLRADAIVNASNPEVALGTGVSGAIREACGGAPYQRLVRSAWEEEFDEPLGPDDCLVTTAGTASAFRWVLHVAAVDYRKPDPETGGPSGPTRIERCTRAALDAAEELAMSESAESFVLGLPLLGAGHGGAGETASAGAMVRALRGWAGPTRQVSTVVFAVLEEPTARIVRAALGL